MRTGYSSECYKADPVHEIPRIDPGEAIALAKEAVKGQPPHPSAGWLGHRCRLQTTDSQSQGHTTRSEATVLEFS